MITVSANSVKVVGYVAGVVIVALVSAYFKLNFQQIVSATIFLAIILGAVTYWRLRLAFATAGVAIMFFTGVLDVPHLLNYAHFDVIVFLMGMMTVIGFLDDRGFFIFFFTSVGTLAFTGITDIIARGVLGFAGKSTFVTTVMLTWIAGGLSAFMDNILAVATLITIIHSLERVGYNVFPSYWGILFGACYLGNLTMIGSTANIVALGIIEKERKRFIGFIDWLKPGLAIALPQLLLATLPIYIQHFLAS